MLPNGAATVFFFQYNFLTVGEKWQTHNEVIGSMSVAVHLYGDNVALTVCFCLFLLNTGSVRVFSKEVDEYFIMQQFCLHFMLSDNREIQSQL